MANKAEIVTTLKGTVIRCAEETADMYKSIDDVCDRLVRCLESIKQCITDCNQLRSSVYSQFQGFLGAKISVHVYLASHPFTHSLIL